MKLRPHTCNPTIWQKKAQRYQHNDLWSLRYDTCSSREGKKLCNTPSTSGALTLLMRYNVNNAYS